VGRSRCADGTLDAYLLRRGQNQVGLGVRARRNAGCEIEAPASWLLGALSPDWKVIVMRMLAYAALFVLSLGSVPSKAQDASRDVTVRLAPFATAESPSLRISSGESVVVRPIEESEDELTPAIFIVGADGVAVAKNEEDSESLRFTWTTVEPRTIVVAVKSRSDKPTAYSIWVGKNELRAPQTESSTPNLSVQKVFYATDRQPVVVASKPVSFTGEPNAGLSFGFCQVSIPRDHRYGVLERPVIWRLEFSPDPKSHFVAGSLSPYERVKFISEVGRAVQGSDAKEALVFVHGFNVSFENAVLRTAQIAYDLHFNGPAIAYSWPSQGSLGPIAYNRDGRNAELTIDRLQGFLEELGTKSGARTIHVIAHSMGTRPVARALAALSASRSPALERFRNVALIAPDIDAEVFRALAQNFLIPENVTLYASSRDGALMAAKLYGGYARAGQAGDGIVVVKGMHTIDASHADTTLLGVMHQYYADSKTVLGDLFQLLSGNPPAKRARLRAVQHRNGQYWEFAR
jgi:esterase/lipase superfamily enzyme